MASRAAAPPSGSAFGKLRAGREAGGGCGRLIYRSSAVDFAVSGTTKPPRRRPAALLCRRPGLTDSSPVAVQLWNSRAIRPAAPMRRKGSVSDTPPNNLNPALAGFFFRGWFRISGRGTRPGSLAALGDRHRRAEHTGVIIKIGATRQMAGDHNSSRHHYKEGRGDEHQADFSKCVTIGHGRLSKIQ